MASFTPEQKEALLPEINEEINNSQRTANLNLSLDVTFRVIVLICSIGTTIFSALGAAFKDKPHPEWALTAAILAGASTALSGFAFTQFNFAARRQSWEKRADAFRALHKQLMFADPDRDTFLARQDEAQRLSDP